MSTASLERPLDQLSPPRWRPKITICDFQQIYLAEIFFQTVRDCLGSPINLMCKLLDCGRKPENPEKAHAHREGTCKLHMNGPPVCSLDSAGSLLPQRMVSNPGPGFTSVQHLCNEQMYLLPSGDRFRSWVIMTVVFKFTF